jgi:signal transduction histidine kinase
LVSAGKVFGAVLFELRYPGNWEKIKKEFQTGAYAAGKVLEAAMKIQNQQSLIEWIMQAGQPTVPTEPQTKQEPEPQPSEQEARRHPTETEKPEVPRIPYEQLNLGLEELAAGAAHELNNPLSVISGRAQLLLNDEQDSQRKQILEKISDSASQLSQIVGGLMSYAQPQQPRKSATSVKQIVDEAGQFAEQKADMEGVDLQVDIKGNPPAVNVDSGQIVSAVANVIVNAVESYGSQKGPVQITVQNDESSVNIEIRDFGCGMDAETLERACYPFFSAKPAGRQRGMGLAYTKRFVELNGGSLSIESEPDQGTTVNIQLPSE